MPGFGPRCLEMNSASRSSSAPRALKGRQARVSMRAVYAEFSGKLEPAALKAAQAAAAIMATNKVYYRFLHLVENEGYGKLPAKLRMNVMANPGTAKENFELWSLAVSAVNGCGKCMAAHEQGLRGAGVSAEQVQAAVRIASVVHAVAVTLEAQDASAGKALPLAA